MPKISTNPKKRKIIGIELKVCGFVHACENPTAIRVAVSRNKAIINEAQNPCEFDAIIEIPKMRLVEDLAKVIPAVLDYKAGDVILFGFDGSSKEEGDYTRWMHAFRVSQNDNARSKLLRDILSLIERKELVQHRRILLKKEDAFY